jgi:predicted dehydrogenase
MDNLWIIGSGRMAENYARVLNSLNQPFEVIGRGVQTAKSFENSIGNVVHAGSLKENLARMRAPNAAIVAVGVDQLAPVTIDLIRAGTKRILLEKPGGLNVEEIRIMSHLAHEANAEVLIAYNRRFYHSVEQARELIAEDGGILGMYFEFTEWSHLVAPLVIGPGVKERWLLANSSHVIDLAYHLGGRPVDWNHTHCGTLDWHPASARFCGAGITERGVVFSYFADWQAPGRWGIEITTKRRRLILRPMEQLQFIALHSPEVKSIEPRNTNDIIFKPGLLQQTRAFLEGEGSLFCTLDEQVTNMGIYSTMAGYL